MAAHQDDIDILAHDGIPDRLDQPDKKAFGCVVATNGAGSPRTGPYSIFTYTDKQMRAARRDEQHRATRLGGYAIQLQLATRAPT